MSYLTEHGTTTDDVQDAADGNITYSASEVADDILENGFANFDYGYWTDLTDAEKAEAFDNLIADFASIKNDEKLPLTEFKAERDAVIKDLLFLLLKHWAQREINRLPRNGLEK